MLIPPRNIQALACCAGACLQSSFCTWGNFNRRKWGFFNRRKLGNIQPALTLLRQLFERDADYAEALWALDRVEGSLDRRSMLRDTLKALDQLPSASAKFRKQLPARAHPTLEDLEASIRPALNPKEAYSMVPGRDPESV